MAFVGVLLWILIVIAALAVLFLLFWRFWFLRDPEREIPAGDVLISPADGVVIKIIDIGDAESVEIKKGMIGKIQAYCADIKKPCCMISIFMNPLDVHRQRVPYSGKVVSVKHEKGKFGSAMSFIHGLENEKSETTIETDKLGRYKVLQIAGLLVRRIENWLKEGQEVKKGDKMGLINFGSQVTLILPKEKLNIVVKEGDKVKAGSSVIAEVR